MNRMKAAVINQFGDERELLVKNVPIPGIGNNQVLIRTEYAGIGSWDIFEREGGYAQMLGLTPAFPCILGSEGAGTVVETGKDVTTFKVGDLVCASGFLNPKGGFYAEYVVVDENTVSGIPKGYSICEASVLLGAGLTALRGLEDVLDLKPGESICIFGASGGVGHIAAQIAHSTGARVCAVVSGTDGLELLRKFGINDVFEGHEKLLLEKIQSSGFFSFDKVLLTAGGPAAEKICQKVKHDGTVAFPAGIFPEPASHKDIQFEKYYGNPDEDIISRIIKAVERYGVKPHIDRVFNLEEAASAHQHLKNHYSGKIALKIF